MTKKKIAYTIKQWKFTNKKIKTDSAYLKLINLVKSNLKIPSIPIYHNLLCETFVMKNQQIGTCSTIILNKKL